MASSQRPKFEPIPLPLPTEPTKGWLPLISCPANFPIEIFEAAISQLVHHPEYNSTLILRSEVIFDTTTDFPSSVPIFNGASPTRCIRRKLLPRRPGRDPALEQICTLYSCSGEKADTLVLTPIVEPGSALPYYHPTVFHLAFRYIQSSTPPTLQIDVDPLPECPTDPNSRLYRTCLALLETLHRYGWGTVTNYKKRINHDCLVSREAYQDLYLQMRERHKHLVGTWREVTDPLKHVFEDIGIATFLMLLWKDTFSGTQSGPCDSDCADPREPWKAWPRPPGGFLDAGCGNGLLTHILVAEGYEGCGIDVRARTSWEHYPEATQAELKVHAFDPTAAEQGGPLEQPYFKRGVFIIGNHADELTPWVPVLSTLHEASGYISIPCCSWAFDQKFERSSTPPFPIPSDDFADSLNLGGEGSNKSSYSMYRIWLAALSLHCGWEVECETLRIPSTRNWAIIGRKRSDSMPYNKALSHANDIVEEVKSRAQFKTRKPEGKAGDH